MHFQPNLYQLCFKNRPNPIHQYPVKYVFFSMLENVTNNSAKTSKKIFIVINSNYVFESGHRFADWPSMYCPVKLRIITAPSLFFTGNNKRGQVFHALTGKAANDIIHSKYWLKKIFEAKFVTKKFCRNS